MIIELSVNKLSDNNLASDNWKIGVIIKEILGLHPREETAMLVDNTIKNGPTSFA